MNDFTGSRFFLSGFFIGGVLGMFCFVFFFFYVGEGLMVGEEGNSILTVARDMSHIFFSQTLSC